MNDELFDYFKRWNGRLAENRGLRVEEGRAVGYYDGLQLHSAFQPLFNAADLAPVACEALLRARKPDGVLLAVHEAFSLPATTADIAYFDRLCRVVHTLNFARQTNGTTELFLNVDGRHLLSVGEGQHGHAFEILLRHCGLKPAQVVLEIIESGIDDLGHLKDAVCAYQKRGFGVAIDDFGSQHSNFDRLWQLTPNVVKLDRGLLTEATVNLRARRILPKLVEIVHDLGAKVVCEGIETHEQHGLACDAGVDLVQGFWYAMPEPALQLESLSSDLPDAFDVAFAKGFPSN